MTKIAIFHNVDRDEHGRRTNFDGYRPGAAMVRVFEYEPETEGTPEDLAETAFFLFNAPLERLGPQDRDIAASYRARALRSLSVGDVVTVDQIALAITPVACHRIASDTFNETHQRDHGTVPLRDEGHTE